MLVQKQIIKMGNPLVKIKREKDDFFYLPEKIGEPYIEVYIEEIDDE